MISYFSSLIILFSSINKKNYFDKFENIDLNNSVNRINFFDFLAFKYIPKFDNSAMDGYVLRLSFNNDNIDFVRKKFFIIDIWKAGDNKSIKLIDNDYVVEIMTGSRIPSLFNSVVKFEDSFLNIRNPFEILLKKVVNLKDNIRTIGEDFSMGNYVLKKGHFISNSNIMSLSTFGIFNINVLSSFNIFLFCTGNEVYDNSNNNLNYNLNDNLINNSLAECIISFFKYLNINVNYMGVVSDLKYNFVNKINDVLLNEKYNIIITTGAVSKGKADFLSSVLIDIGAKIYFHGVLIKPGKPILFAKYNEKNYFFGLPGNPISSFIGLRFFIYNFLMYLNGSLFERPFKAILESDYYFNNKYDLFLKCFTYFNESNFHVKILNDQESFKINSFSKSNSFLFVKKNESPKKGDSVAIYFYKPFIYC